MSGEWIKMRANLAEDPAVIGVAIALGIDEAAVVGHLHRLWSWADQQTIDGNAVGVTETWLDRYIGVTGFVRAMVEVGWLTIQEGDSGGIQIPNFDVHNSQSAKERGLTARRVARSRAQKCNAAGVTKTLPEKRREEKRRKKKKPPIVPLKKVTFDPLKVELPFDSPEFGKAWADFCQHRQLKKPLTELATTKILAKCGRFGEAHAIEALDTAVENDWKGIFQPKGTGSAASPTRRSPGRIHR